MEKSALEDRYIFAKRRASSGSGQWILEDQLECKRYECGLDCGRYLLSKVCRHAPYTLWEGSHIDRLESKREEEALIALDKSQGS